MRGDLVGDFQRREVTGNKHALAKELAETIMRAPSTASSSSDL
ncbi:hypothetical protein ACH40F_49355 [Streptomyces sp. NPDC020794]